MCLVTEPRVDAKDRTQGTQWGRRGCLCSKCSCKELGWLKVCFCACRSQPAWLPQEPAPHLSLPQHCHPAHRPQDTEQGRSRWLLGCPKLSCSPCPDRPARTQSKHGADVPEHRGEQGQTERWADGMGPRAAGWAPSSTSY